jgi:hypothetical protein
MVISEATLGTGTGDRARVTYFGRQEDQHTDNNSFKQAVAFHLAETRLRLCSLGGASR